MAVGWLRRSVARARNGEPFAGAYPPQPPPALDRSGERAQRLLQRAGGRQHGGRLVAAVGHAVGAARIASAPVLLPLGGLDQLAVAAGVAVRHQVAGALPAERREARDGPGRAVELGLALQEIQEERRVVEAPAA